MAMRGYAGPSLLSLMWDRDSSVLDLGLTSPELTWPLRERAQGLLRPGLDNTRLFMSLTAGAGPRLMNLALF